MTSEDSNQQDFVRMIYYTDDQSTPYLTKLAIPPVTAKITLGSVKNALGHGNRYFFKATDPDIGEVREELTNDHDQVPLIDGKIVCWTRTDGTTDPGGSNNNESKASRAPNDGKSIMSSTSSNNNNTDFDDSTTSSSRTLSDGNATSTATGETITSRRRPNRTSQNNQRRRRRRLNNRRRILKNPPPNKPIPFQKEMSVLSSSSSTCSEASSTLSLSIITVSLKLLPSRFLGISVVSDTEGIFGTGGGDYRGGRLTEGGVYVGSVVADGIVAMDGRIEAGDMILQVNEQSLEDLTNEQAVQVIRNAVSTGKFIKLVVAKRWDAIPRAKSRHDAASLLASRAPAQPMNTLKWATQQAIISESKHSYQTDQDDDRSSSIFEQPSDYELSTVIHDDEDEDNLDATLTDDIGDHSNFDTYFNRPSQSDLNDFSSCSVLNLSASSDMEAICRAMLATGSGLDIRDRMWLKLRIPNGFLGSDLVNWLNSNVSGFADKRDARKFAKALLRAGYIRNTVDKISFSEQCYYVFSQHLISQTMELPPDLNSIDSFTSRSVRSRSCRPGLPCTLSHFDHSRRTLVRTSTLRSYGSAFNPSIADTITSRSQIADIFGDRSAGYSKASSSSSNSTITAANDSFADRDFNGFVSKHRRHHCEWPRNGRKNDIYDNNRDIGRLSQSMSRCTINSADRSNNVIM